MKFFKTLLLSAATGAAAAYFFNSRKGQEVAEKVKETYDDYKANPSDYHQKAKDLANEYKDLAVTTYQDYKGKVENGELTKEDVFATVKDKATQAVDVAGQMFSQVTDKWSEVTVVRPETSEEPTLKAEVDDIVIDYPETEESQED